jgi:predicted nucleotidyltransferase
LTINYFFDTLTNEAGTRGTTLSDDGKRVERFGGGISRRASASRSRFARKHPNLAAETRMTKKANVMSRTRASNGRSRPNGIEMKEIRNKVKAITEKYEPEKVILFGSYAARNATSASDVDLLVIINTKRSTWDLAVEISSSLKHSFPMDILVRTPREIARRLKYGDFFIKDIMEKGKVLYERTGE